MPDTATERFDRMVDRSAGATECWPWTGYVDPGGYGRFFVRDAGADRAHRFSYRTAKGAIPEGMQIDHLCRNRRCVNPLHLEAVTQRTNVLRGAGPTAENAVKVECSKGHPLAGDNVLITSTGNRNCRTCHREYQRPYQREWQKQHRAAKRREVAA